MPHDQGFGNKLLIQKEKTDKTVFPLFSTVRRVSIGVVQFGVHGFHCASQSRGRDWRIGVRVISGHRKGGMSASPPEADMDQRDCDVRFVPKAVVSRCIK
jgi:hypothetical protein